MSKKTLGIILGIFFGILGLLGLLMCEEKQEKEEFMSGWTISLIINVVVFVILITIYMSSLSSMIYY